ncbi:MAG: ribosomal protein [Candidatus Parcubacteria bacterium]|jgi:large subunit ribosomal protein L13
MSMKRNHTIIDASGKAIGRLATEVATYLQGKNKVTWQAHIDGGDSVEIRNAAKVKIAGKRMEQKEYFNYSGHPGGMRKRQLKSLMAKNPAEAIEIAVSSMLPKNKHRKIRMARLKVHND